MTNRVDRKLTTQEKETALWDGWLDAGLRFIDGKAEGDEVDKLTKMVNVMVKDRGVKAHQEGNALGFLTRIHTNPESLAKAAAALRPDLKKLPGE